MYMFVHRRLYVHMYVGVCVCLPVCLGVSRCVSVALFPGVCVGLMKEPPSKYYFPVLLKMCSKPYWYVYKMTCTYNVDRFTYINILHRSTFCSHHGSWEMGDAVGIMLQSTFPASSSQFLALRLCLTAESRKLPQANMLRKI